MTKRQEAAVRMQRLFEMAGVLHNDHTEEFLRIIDCILDAAREQSDYQCARELDDQVDDIAEIQRLNVSLVEAWKGTPEGTDVMVRRDSGAEMSSKTRSAPWLLGGHTAVIMLEGISGAYSLDRVRRMP